MALPNDADDMHKMLHQRREELKQIKEQKTQLKKGGLMGNSEDNLNNLLHNKQSMNSLYDVASQSQGNMPGLDSISKDGSFGLNQSENNLPGIKKMEIEKALQTPI